MKAYRVTGDFEMGRDRTPFGIEVAAADEEAAKEKVLSTIGSRHRVNRRKINITGTTEVATDAIQDPVVAQDVSRSG